MRHYTISLVITATILTLISAHFLCHNLINTLIEADYKVFQSFIILNCPFGKNYNRFWVKSSNIEPECTGARSPEQNPVTHLQNFLKVDIAIQKFSIRHPGHSSTGERERGRETNLQSSAISIKSTTMMPPISLSRNSLAI